MSILKIKNEDGTWQSIDTIRGEKGDKGDPGTITDEQIEEIEEEVKDSIEIPTKTSQLTNDSGFITKQITYSMSADADNPRKFALTPSDFPIHGEYVVEIPETDISGKQDILTAGDNITIENNVISATNTTYTAGDNITITNNVISASGGVTRITQLTNLWALAPRLLYCR